MQIFKKVPAYKDRGFADSGRASAIGANIDDRPGPDPFQGADPYAPSFAPVNAGLPRGDLGEDTDPGPNGFSAIPPYNPTIRLEGFENTFPAAEIWPVPNDVREVLCSVPEQSYALELAPGTSVVWFDSPADFYVNFGGAARVPFTSLAGPYDASTGRPVTQSRSIRSPKKAFFVSQTRVVYVAAVTATIVQAWCWGVQKS
jgi:hypothetical protein